MNATTAAATPTLNPSAQEVTTIRDIVADLSRADRSRIIWACDAYLAADELPEGTEHADTVLDALYRLITDMLGFTPTHRTRRATVFSALRAARHYATRTA